MARNNIMHVAMAMKIVIFRYGSSSRVVQQHNNGGGGSNVLADERTLYVTFSEGYHVKE